MISNCVKKDKTRALVCFIMAFLYMWSSSGLKINYAELFSGMYLSQHNLNILYFRNMHDVLQSSGNVMSCRAIKGGLSSWSAFLFISLYIAFF